MKFIYPFLFLLTIAAAMAYVAAPSFSLVTNEPQPLPSAPEVVPAQPLRMLFMGDTMLGRAVGVQYARGTDLFANFRGPNATFMQGYDLVVANLEGPITETEECQNKEIVFKFAPSVAQMLKNNGVTHVSLANNHSYDCLSQGLIDTKRYLDEAGIRYAGGGRTLPESTITETVRGTRIAILGIDRTIAPHDPELIYEHLGSLEGAHDYTIVEVHWGNEYETTESESQRTLARGMIDAGADLIIGHHPHVVQPIEVYNRKPIFYSLGNFIFDQIGEATNTGIAISLERSEADTAVTVHPYTINPSRQPTHMTSERKNTYCQALAVIGISRQQDPCTFTISHQ